MAMDQTYPWHAARGTMTPNPGEPYSEADLNKIAREGQVWRGGGGDWKVEDEHGALIGEFASGKAAFAAAQAYLAGIGDNPLLLPGTSNSDINSIRDVSPPKVFVIYPDGFRLVERKNKAKVAA